MISLFLYKHIKYSNIKYGIIKLTKLSKPSEFSFKVHQKDYIRIAFKVEYIANGYLNKKIVLATSECFQDYLMIPTLH